MKRRWIAMVLVAGCQRPHTAAVAPSCTEPQTRESVDCKSFDFEVRASQDATWNGSRPASVQILHLPSRTECGCFTNLANVIADAANNDFSTQVINGCHCKQER